MSDEAFAEKLHRVRLDNPYELFGCFTASNQDLAVFAGKGPVNTDDRPIVTFGAPKFVYGQKQPSHMRLLELLKSVHPKPEDIIYAADSKEDRQFRNCLAAYWAARNKFLKAGVGVAKTGDVKELLKSVRGPLLDVVRTSADFSAAYRPLLAMAYSLSKTDPRWAEQLLLDLEKAGPHRDEARQLRLKLFAERPMAGIQD